MQRHVKYTSHLAAQHTARLDDLENRMCHNNVHALGIPERTEGKNPVTFIEQWLLSIFDTFSHLFAFERAHRIPMCPLPPGQSPAPIPVQTAKLQGQRYHTL